MTAPLPYLFATASQATVIRQIIQLMMDYPGQAGAIGLNKNGSIDHVNETSQVTILEPVEIPAPSILADVTFWEQHLDWYKGQLETALNKHDITYDHDGIYDEEDPCEVRKAKAYARVRNSFTFFTGNLSVDGVLFDNARNLDVQISDWLKGAPNRSSEYLVNEDERTQQSKYDKRVSTVRLMVDGKTVRIVKDVSSAPRLFVNYQRTLYWFTSDADYNTYMEAFYPLNK